MPFEKGRQKTGGRKKGGAVTARKSKQLIDQLKDHGFNYVKELAACLKEQPFSISPKYLELKSLLVFMAPKLKEREVELVDDDANLPAAKPITDADLLKVLDDGTPKTPKRRDEGSPVAERNPVVEVPASTENNLPDVAGEQKQD